MRRALLALALLAPSAAPAAEPETYVVTWGDSITKGDYDDSAPVNCYDTNDPPEECGHTGRLGSRLNNVALFSPIYDIGVLNLGKGGEKTPGALSRMDRTYWTCPCTEAEPQACGVQNLKYWVCNGTLRAEDLLVLMEGTNDISQGGEISLETTRTNLRNLGTKAAALGLNVVISTVVQRHPDACEDPSNTKTTDLNVEIGEVAAEKGWPLVDPFGRLDVLANLYSGYYQHVDPMRCAQPAPNCDNQNCDPVGHPDGAGYDKMTFDGGAYYAKTFESVVRKALPPRLNVTPPTPPLEHGTDLAFAAALPDLAQTDRLVWDFGDGTVVPTEPNASPAIQEHVYAEPGVYTVVVTAEHANGGDRQRTLVVEVSVLFADGFESGNTSEWTTGSD